MQRPCSKPFATFAATGDDLASAAMQPGALPHEIDLACYSFESESARAASTVVMQAIAPGRRIGRERRRAHHPLRATQMNRIAAWSGMRVAIPTNVRWRTDTP